MKKELEIYVFSYNRGVFLDNCLQSIQNCAPDFPVYVIDDFSDDEGTKKIILKWQKKVKIIRSNKLAGNDYKVGSLYYHMNSVLQKSIEKKAKYVLFIQDDMQLVRKITDFDLRSFEDFFLENQNSFQLNTCFMKLRYSEFDDHQSYLDLSGKAYFRPIGNGQFAGFSAVGVFNVFRFKELLGEIVVDQELNEKANNTLAESRNIQMGFSTYPFMMWLPMPRSNRGHRYSITHSLVEQIGGAGFYPYKYMSTKETESFLSRDVLERPYAERFLECPEVSHIPIWAFSGGIVITSIRGGWRRNLGNLINKLSVGRKVRRLKGILSKS